MGLVKRARALQDYRATKQFPVMLEAVTRATNIVLSAADKVELSHLAVDKSLFVDISETALFEQIEAMEKVVQPALIAGDYQVVFAALFKISSYINDFFEAVMVMDQDVKIRDNRLALLQRLVASCQETADLSKIVS